MTKDTFETVDNDRTEDDEPATSDPIPYRQTLTVIRRAAPKKIIPKKKPVPYRKPNLSSTDSQSDSLSSSDDTPAPYQKPSLSSTDSQSDSLSSSDDTPAPRGPPLRRLGIDIRTGELTLIGQFPPIIGDDRKTYWCPHEACLQYWKTRNGYKYHLKHVCPQNPESTRSLRAAMAPKAQAIDPRTTRKKRF
jgi:hypothetical protein